MIVVLYEVVNHDVFEIAQHNHQVAVGDHTKWHGGEWYVHIASFSWDTHNGEHPVVVLLHTRAFVRVSNIGDKRVGHSHFFQIGEIVLIWVAYIYPAAFLPLVNLRESFSK